MISVKEKIAYGLGDTASNIIFQTVMMFLLIYYTDVVGLAPEAVGTMFLIVRIFDAVTDPIMGNIADRTRSKWGQFRPFLLWLALPFGLISVLAFTTPDLADDQKLIYAFVTYTLLMLVYTAINIPYCALGGALTANPKERVSVQSYRFVLAMLGGVFVASCTMPLVEWFGSGDKAKGYQLTMAAMSVVGVLFFLVCFAGTKERVRVPSEHKHNFIDGLKLLWQNDQARLLCLAGLFLLTGQVLKITLAVYYVKYILVREDLITPFMTIGMVGSMLGCAFSQTLAKYVCKIKAYISLQLLAVAVCALAIFIAPDQTLLACAAFFIWKFLLDMATPLLWAMMADTIDYGEWKIGIRLSGMVYSTVIFFIKLGIALGGALAGWALAYYGYQADTTQTAETQQGILYSFTLFPALGSLIAALIMTRYTLTSSKIEQIHLAFNAKSS
ncbi:MFS transporter [Shewanella sp. Scap07]|uniref:glycoside-pentoside-hexuronide (GPH):cation symporter n=1 Tax=Shewanella sp. Scap07 TaxID=2589987 RepID=UPI0015BFFD7A|nr:glycoside-pentoside-hexuronide (GPH):cation symporter [Shewanella sp. Scap07]QLE86035.1 MFS transporter [Shewanella sp. Scap07]